MEEVKIRATTLRTQFTKLLKPKPSGSGEKGLTQKQSWLLRSLEFLKKHVAQRPSETNVRMKVLLLNIVKYKMHVHPTDETVFQLDQSVKDTIESQEMDNTPSDEDIIDTSETPGIKCAKLKNTETMTDLFCPHLKLSQI